MKNILVGLMLIGSFSVMAQDMNIQKCSEKVSRTVKAIASIELGKDIQVANFNQDSLSTATNFKITVVSNKEQHTWL